MKIDKHFKKALLLFCCIVFISNIYGHQVNLKNVNFLNDTTIIGKLIDTDSIFLNIRTTYFGTKYFYGVHHFKIALTDITNNKKNDTIIIAYVYNNLSEHSLYLENFNLKIDSDYIFEVNDFTPCKSDFPRIQGLCDENDYFIPESNKLIKKYKTIYRIINVFSYDKK